MSVIAIHFTDGTHRTARTLLITIFPDAKYAVWFHNESPASDHNGQLIEQTAYPKKISLVEADAVFDGLMKFHQNGWKSQKDLAHFLIDHGCSVSKLPSRWNGDGWNGNYCDNLNVEVL